MDFICFPILLFTGLILISILTGVIVRWLGVPLILLFILIGLLIESPETPLLTQGLLTAENVFFLGSVALALILFDSGFNTRMSHFKTVAKPSIVLASLGVCVGALLLAPIVMILLDVSFIEGLLLSSIIGSTDAAAVFFLLRSQKLFLKNRVKSTLEVESGANDPMAIFLTFGCLGVLGNGIASFSQDVYFLLFSLIQQAGIGTIGGYILFWALRLILTRINLELALFPLFVLSFVMAGFAAITWIGGSGYLAVYLCGLLIGNTPVKAHSTLLKFQQTITWLSQIILFVALGLFVRIGQLIDVWHEAIIIGIFLTIVVRPAMIFGLLSFFKKYSFSEKVFISFVGLRGATSVLLALTPIVFKLPFGDLFLSIVFVMVVFSLSIQGFLIPFVAKKCNVITTYQTIPPERTSVDLPGLIQSNLIIYELGENSAVLRGHDLPQWAQPLLLKRNAIVYQPNNMPTLKEKDKVYVFAPNEQRVHLLDKLYGNRKCDTEIDIFGDFPIDPAITFGDLHHIYGINIDNNLISTSVVDYIQSEFPKAHIGDRFTFDSIEIIIRTKQHGKITELGLDIDPVRHNHNI